jgi:hypothetical protein
VEQEITTRAKMQKLRVVPGREQTGLFPRELLLLKKHYREFYLQLECRLATCSKNKSPGKCRRDRRRRGLGGERAGGVQGVAIEPVAGELSDHYDSSV